MSLTERDVVKALEEDGLEENSGSYLDYRDAREILRVDQMNSEDCKNITVSLVKKYFNLT